MRYDLIVLAMVSLACSSAAAAPGGAPNAQKTAASGKTQVVAKIAGREITLTELRIEMSRLGVSGNDPAGERAALESLINRVLLSKAARDAELHRKPEAMARMYAAQDQALSEYYLALASQPVEPTRNEIDDYIRNNPSLFAARKTYQFSVMTLATANFNEKTLTPLFDKDADFTRLAAVLDKAGAAYSIAPAVQSGATFPAAIREQLAQYGVRDNIVVKGDESTQILKIISQKADPGDPAEWPQLSRRILMEQSAAKRADELLARLRGGADVAYYRPTAAPQPAGKAK